MLNWAKHDEIPTQDLVELISWRDPDDIENDDLAKKAAAVFFDRFRIKVSNKCEILCARWNQPLQTAEMLLEETFGKFFEGNKFDISKASTSDYDKAIELYLYRTAFNSLIDHYRRSISKYASRYTGEEQIIRDFHELSIVSGKVETTKKLQDKLWLLERALEHFDWKHRLIYLSYMNAGVAEEEYPPRHLTKQIREVTGLTQRSVRVYKKAVTDQVKIIMNIYAKAK